MLSLKSQEFIVAAASDQVLRFLSETKNYALLLPENQTSDFQFTPTQFSFKAAGQVNLALEIQASQNHALHFRGLQTNPFAFDLYVHLQPQANSTSGYIEIKADLNMMLKMLIEKPLQKLLAEMATNLSKQLGS
jgi:carbon monoxide dehydrogenase subunit G